jgi:serine/threonine protein kinase/flagellar motor switch/type III secretory pathway protein FliN
VQDRIQRLQELARLRDEKKITEQEFQFLKDSLLQDMRQGIPMLSVAQDPGSSPFELGELIGIGTLGRVYEGSYKGEPAAFKILHADWRNEATLARFMQFGQLLGSLKHPGIVESLDVILQPDPMLVMELLDGAPFSVNDEPVPAQAVDFIIQRLLEGLSYLHGEGWTHGDIKPGNIVLCRDGQVKILDPGLYRVLNDEGRLQRGEWAGSLGYMAPERFSGPHGFPSDIYSVGLLAWELLTGRSACSYTDPLSQREWHENQGPQSLSALSECPPWMAHTVQLFCSKSPLDRPENAQAALLLWLEQTVPELPKLRQPAARSHSRGAAAYRAQSMDPEPSRSAAAQAPIQEKPVLAARPAPLAQQGRFDFLRELDPELFKSAAKAERYYHDDPPTAIIHLRRFGEILGRRILESTDLPTEDSEGFGGMIGRLEGADSIPSEVAGSLIELRKAGNLALDQGLGDAGDAEQLLDIAWNLGAWLKVWLSEAGDPPVQLGEERGFLRLIKRLSQNLERFLKGHLGVQEAGVKHVELSDGWLMDLLQRPGFQNSLVQVPISDNIGEERGLLLIPYGLLQRLFSLSTGQEPEEAEPSTSTLPLMMKAFARRLFMHILGSLNEQLPRAVSIGEPSLKLPDVGNELHLGELRVVGQGRIAIGLPEHFFMHRRPRPMPSTNEEEDLDWAAVAPHTEEDIVLGISVSLTANSIRLRIPFQQVKDLREGSVIPLPRNWDSEIRLLINGRQRFVGVCGDSEGKRAVRITRIDDDVFLPRMLLKG